MLICLRTTLNLPDGLVAQAKAHAAWSELEQLAQTDRGVRGNLVPDALLAALARTHGCLIATADRGFARFPGIRTVNPTA